MVDSKIPDEIFKFFGDDKSHCGRSLVIKGKAGTGKTTFALQLMEEINVNNSFYLSTRVSDEALYSHFPWLRDKETKGKIIDSSKMLLQALCPEEKEEPMVPVDTEIPLDIARGFLSTITEEERGPPSTVDKRGLTVLLEQCRMPEVERIYDSIDHILPERSLLVVDSIEGITHKYGIDAEILINTLQKDLVENSNTNLVLVLERADAPELAFLVDGVIGMTRELVDKRIIRQVHLEKLRATQINQHSYLTTLTSGRFRSFDPFYPDFSAANKWASVQDNGVHYSTGIEDLDRLLDGGFKKGSYNVIEIAENVSNEEYMSVIRPLLLNFVTQGRGIMAVLSGGKHPYNLKEDLLRFVPEDAFANRVRVIDYFSPGAQEPFIMALGGKNRDEARRIWIDNLNKIRDGGKGAILDYTGFDTLEYLRGDTIAIKDLFSAVSQTKISNDLGIGLIKPGLKLTQEIMNMSDTYLKIIDIDKCPCIYGVKPKTVVYAITPHEKGVPYIKLTPIV
jgi:KaiC/GvpD/RAD55 family RecA-like ATPase